MTTLPAFDGETFEPERDGERLAVQLNKVKNLMSDHKWRTLFEISKLTAAPEASVSARLRDLRKAKNGSYTVERRHVGGGIFEYRVLGKWLKTGENK